VQKTHNQEVAGSEFHTDLILYSKLIWVIWMLIKKRYWTSTVAAFAKTLPNRDFFEIQLHFG
jgi:hypothetical protein